MFLACGMDGGRSVWLISALQIYFVPYNPEFIRETRVHALEPRTDFSSLSAGWDFARAAFLSSEQGTRVSSARLCR